jgi:hypothetical protein
MTHAQDELRERLLTRACEADAQPYSGLLREAAAALAAPQADQQGAVLDAEVADVLGVLDGWGLTLRDRVGKKPAMQISDVAALIRRLAAKPSDQQGASLEGEAGEPLSTSYIQRVPDKCDRIIWRGAYFALPKSLGGFVERDANDPTLPYESALAKLIDRIVPGLDSGDILADAATALASGASPEAVGVDEEMVERASLAYEVALDGEVYGPDVPRVAMRSALKAALAAQGGGAGNG